MELMPAEFVERVRLTAEQARKLREIARRTKRTKSEVLRAGLESQYEGLVILEARAKALPDMLRFAKKYPEEPKVRFRMK